MPQLGQKLAGGLVWAVPQCGQKLDFVATGFVGACGCCVGLGLLFLLDRKTTNNMIPTGIAKISSMRKIRMISPPPKLPRNAKCKKSFICLVRENRKVKPRLMFQFLRTGARSLVRRA